MREKTKERKATNGKNGKTFKKITKEIRKLIAEGESIVIHRRIHINVIAVI